MSEHPNTDLPDFPTRRHSNLLAVAAMMPLAASACGSGDSEGSGQAPTDTESSVPSLPVGLAQQRASRFLAQATNGATRNEIEAVVEMGIDSWLDSQFAMERGSTHIEWLTAQGYAEFSRRNDDSGWDASVWQQIISFPDQLRQKIAISLLDIFVVSLVDLTDWKAVSIGQYMDVLLDNAFGNYRSMLGEITTCSAMGNYLTYIGSAKSTLSGRTPDENYARELMQLFTIGLYKLNIDGSPALDSSGSRIETYNQNDVSQLARVFTGFNYGLSERNTSAHRLAPLAIIANLNDTGTCTFLGKSVSGGGMAAVEAALDIIFAHSNVAPFFAENLITRLVMSNPSPAYIERVATVFNDNGFGIRGDMKAIIRAILKDPEARSDESLSVESAGKLRAPVQRITNWARAFRAKSAAGTWKIGSLSDPQSAIAQSPGRSPSVFNFFQSDYSPPNSVLASRGLVAPEFQIADELTVISYINFMSTTVYSGLAKGDVAADYSDLIPLAPDPTVLVSEVSIRLTAGQLRATTTQKIAAAVKSIALSQTDGALLRVKAAILLTIVSPDYLAQR